ncbi:MAG: hypothetical protein NTZ97_04505 [Candidatus Moranbacteria bacterium]|nr:hypothetical protein [Candidatus Moranbacteria bacterium]
MSSLSVSLQNALQTHLPAAQTPVPPPVLHSLSQPIDVFLGAVPSQNCSINVVFEPEKHSSFRVTVSPLARRAVRVPAIKEFLPPDLVQVGVTLVLQAPAEQVWLAVHFFAFAQLLPHLSLLVWRSTQFPSPQLVVFLSGQVTAAGLVNLAVKSKSFVIVIVQTAPGHLDQSQLENLYPLFGTTVIITTAFFEKLHLNFVSVCVVQGLLFCFVAFELLTDNTFPPSPAVTVKLYLTELIWLTPYPPAIIRPPVASVISAIFTAVLVLVFVCVDIFFIFKLYKIKNFI